MTRPTTPRIPRNHVVTTADHMEHLARLHDAHIELAGPNGYATMRLGDLQLAALPAGDGEPVAVAAERVALGGAA